MSDDHRTRVLTAADVRELLQMADCIDAVEQILTLHARGEVAEPGVLGVHAEGGGFHLKAAIASLGRVYFAVKCNGNFPANPASRGLPTIQGIIVLCDATDGRPLAVLDSVEVTTLRTGAATAVAAKYLARPGSSTVSIVGCGVQGRAQLRALAEVLPITRAFGIDVNALAAQSFAAWATDALNIPTFAPDDSAEATRSSDVVVTCTPSSRALLGVDDVVPGVFIAAVGADNPQKHEIDVGLMSSAAVVTDSLDQCVAFGDLHHAVAAGSMQPGDTRGELGQVVIGAVQGRRSDDEVIIFDSTGTALQDVAASALVYERAVESGRGLRVAFAD